MFEDFGCSCFGPVSECAVDVVDNGGESNVCHIHIRGAVAEVNGVFDALFCRHDF